MRKTLVYFVFQFYVPSLDLFFRSKHSFPVSVAFCFRSFTYSPQVWNVLVEVIFTARNFPISRMDLPSRKKTVGHAWVPLLVAARKADLTLIPLMNMFFRVDHLYTFFVQWSPDVYGKDAKEQGFVVVEKEELNMIDNFFSEPTTKSWEVSTQAGARLLWSSNHSIQSKCS